MTPPRELRRGIPELAYAVETSLAANVVMAGGACVAGIGCVACSHREQRSCEQGEHESAPGSNPARWFLQAAFTVTGVLQLPSSNPSGLLQD